MNHTTVNDTVYALAVSQDILYAARTAGVYRSLDGGQTWQNTFESTPDLHGIAATALTVRDGTVIAGINGGIAVSPDEGVSWQVRGLAALPPLVVDITFMDDRVLAATADDGVFISDDGGTTWTAWNFGLIDMRVNCLTVAPHGMILAGTESDLFSSHNGGKSWTNMPFPPDSAPVLSLAVTPDLLFAGTQSSGLLYADHDGTNWAAVPDLDMLADAVVHGLLYEVDDLLILTDRRLIRLATIDLSHQVLHQFPEREALVLTRTEQQVVIGFADGSIEIIPIARD